MNRQKYDCIVIGAGISGLLVSNMLAHKGKRVLVLEKNNYSGGFFARFRPKDYEMDYAVSYFLGVEDNGTLNRFLTDIQLADKLDFVKVPLADYYIFPELEFGLKSDHLSLKDDLCKLFPLEIEGIHTFFEVMKYVYYSFMKLKSPKSLPQDLLIRKYLTKSYSFYLNDLFADNKLKAILSARVFGSNVGMITMVSYMGKLILEGLFQERNNRSITNSLAYNLHEKQVDVLYNTLVESVVIEDKFCKSVIVKNQVYEADFVVSTCDMTKMFCSVIKAQVSDTIKHRLYDRPKSLSSISLYLVLKRLPKKIRNIKASRIYIFSNYDIVESYKKKEQNILDLENGIKINIENVMGSDFKNCAAYKMRVEIDTSYDTPIAESDKESIRERLIDILEKNIKITKDDVLEASILFPKDFEKMTFSSMGAASGWAPDSSFTNFSSFQKDIACNFFQVGCWDKYGSGIFPIFLSAKEVVTKFIK